MKIVHSALILGLSSLSMVAQVKTEKYLPHFTEINQTATIIEVLEDLKAHGAKDIREQDFGKATPEVARKIAGGWPQYKFTLENFYGLSPGACHVTFRDGRPWRYYVCWQVPHKSTYLYYTVLKDYFKGLYKDVKVREFKSESGEEVWFNLDPKITMAKAGSGAGSPDSMQLSITYGSGPLFERVYLLCFVGKEKRPTLNLLGVSDWFETPRVLLDTNPEGDKSKQQ